MTAYTLYGVEASYYAAKIRADLPYKKIPFTEVQASRLFDPEEILPRVRWPCWP